MRPHTQNARRALLLGTATYIALQASLIMILTRGAPWLRDPAYGLRAERLRQRLDGASQRPYLVVMVGSSRTVFGLNGQAIEPSLHRDLGRPVLVQNFGEYGAGSFTNLLTLNRLLDDGLRPDLVLLEIVPSRLGRRSIPEDLNESFLPLTSLRREELSLVRSHAGKGRVVLDLDWWLSWASPAYSHRLSLISHSVPVLLSYADRRNSFDAADASGWLSLGNGMVQEPADEKGRREVDKDLDIIVRDGPEMQALRAALERCRREHIPAAVVLMPETRAYRAGYPASFLRRIPALLAELEACYTIATIDAREWIGEEGFLDGHHLLAAGARTFSERLAREVILPVLRKARVVEQGEAP